MQRNMTYRIEIAATLTAAEFGWFEDLQICATPGAGTVLLTPPIDQTALHGILATLRDLAIPLVAVQEVAYPPGADRLAES
ncbi:MAG TPA: hypothetical protein VKY74_27160 [Chloroflexia bacterium]|nr:hypothetical protein [Chloroflexia bacterium]